MFTRNFMRFIFPTLVGLFSFDALSLELVSKAECQNIITASESLAKQSFRADLRVHINLDGKERSVDVLLKYKDGEAELISMGKDSPDIDKGALGTLLSPLTNEDCKYIYLDGRNVLVKISKDESLMMSREFDYQKNDNTLTPINMALDANVSMFLIDYSIKTNFHFKQIEYTELK
jgi:hypothetical protein